MVNRMPNRGEESRRLGVRHLVRRPRFLGYRLVQSSWYLTRIECLDHDWSILIGLKKLHIFPATLCDAPGVRTLAQTRAAVPSSSPRSLPNSSRKRLGMFIWISLDGNIDYSGIRLCSCRPPHRCLYCRKRHPRNRRKEYFCELLPC